MKDHHKKIASLHARAVALLASAETRSSAIGVLRELSLVLGAEDDHYVFVHKTLAELLLEDEPWVASLHLKRVVQIDTNDDVVYALMGLCQTLLGNFRYAASCYRTALRFSPHNPWYQHNLGHLLDVALDNPRAAEPFLRAAVDETENEPELIASLAHCTARLGDFDEARALARALVPRDANKSHEILAWVDRQQGTAQGVELAHHESPAIQQIEKTLLDTMRQAGYSDEQIAWAQDLWTQYVRAATRIAVQKPEPLAAALEFTASEVFGLRASKASVARRYRVTPSTLSRHHQSIREVLGSELAEEQRSSKY